MREIITESGTVYTIDSGRITREGDTSFVGEIVNRTFRFVGESPRLGERFIVNVFGVGEIVTTRVVKVNDWRNYCPRHDFYDCIFCPQDDERVNWGEVRGPRIYGIAR